MKKQVTISTVSVRVLELDGVLHDASFKVYGKIGQSKAVKLANEKFNMNIIVPSVVVTTETKSIDVILPELK